MASVKSTNAGRISAVHIHFYMLDGKLEVSECMGIGKEISNKKALWWQCFLKERYITEIKESIALLEKFKGFIPDGSGSVCVHDSEGEHWIKP